MIGIRRLLNGQPVERLEVEHDFEETVDGPVVREIRVNGVVVSGYFVIEEDGVIEMTTTPIEEAPNL